MVHQCGRAIPEKEVELLWVWQPRSPGERLLEGPEGTTRKVGLNLKERMAKKGGWSSQKLVAT